MKALTQMILSCLLVVNCVSYSNADEKGRHPGYLHVLKSLQEAQRYLADKTETPQYNTERQQAIGLLDKAIEETKQAAVQVGKDLNAPVNEYAERKSHRLEFAQELMKSARGPLAEPEDDPRAHQMQQQAIGHLNEALRIVDSLVVKHNIETTKATVPDARKTTVPEKPSFTLTSSISSTSVAAGGSTTITLTTAPANGFKSPIALSVSGIPKGVTASITPPSILSPGNGSSNLKISVARSTTAGTCSLIVRAMGGGVTKTQEIRLSY